MEPVRSVIVYLACVDIGDVFLHIPICPRYQHFNFAKGDKYFQFVALLFPCTLFCPLKRSGHSGHRYLDDLLKDYSPVHLSADIHKTIKMLQVVLSKMSLCLKYLGLILYNPSKGISSRKQTSLSHISGFKVKETSLCEILNESL